jgi:hypothetical protein
VKLLFKWIKQHWHSKGFYGTSENAVKTQLDRCVDVRAGRHRAKAEANLLENPNQRIL